MLSGAYAVFEGAPALVAAVDRYATANTEQPATFVAEEVREAVDRGYLEAPVWFDAGPLRDDERKLGLGSSAAILVASLRAAHPERALEQVFREALAAHRAAQGGGSGIDVAAACFGGVVRCRRSDGGELEVSPHVLPALETVVVASGHAASTRGMLAAVRAFAADDPDAYRATMATLIEGAARAAATREGDELIAALGAQFDGFRRLGAQAKIPIVTEAVARLDELAAEEGARFGPSGAGGGDVAVYYGLTPPTRQWLDAVEAEGMVVVPLTLGAPGATTW